MWLPHYGGLAYQRWSVCWFRRCIMRLTHILQADKTASTALFSGILAGAAIIACIMIFLQPILTSLGATETILPYAKAYARIYVTGSIINVFTVTMNNLLTAQGAAKFTMIAMLSRQGIFFFPLVMILPHMFGLAGVIYVQPMADLLSTIITVIFAMKISRILTSEAVRGREGVQ